MPSIWFCGRPSVAAEGMAIFGNNVILIYPADGLFRRHQEVYLDHALIHMSVTATAAYSPKIYLAPSNRAPFPFCACPL